ncbi:toprim domain-containing protein [Salmonella enterica]|nr:toprim domain-containing protein [Salmonella enterica subsp. enterica serovar Saintpaul]EEC1303366.1 toprim domain-containing protein [Salmonella enterica]
MSLPLPALNDIIEQFRSAMREQGIECTDRIEADGNIHRFHVKGDRSGRKNGWYTLHYDQYPAGVYGCHKRYPDQQFPWKLEGEDRKLSPDEERQVREFMENAKREREEKERKRNEKARIKAAKIWAEAVPCKEHEYLTRKGVNSYGLRTAPWFVWDADQGREVKLTDNALLIPLYDRDRIIHSIQAIIPDADLREDDDSAKKFLPGGAKKEKFYVIGDPCLHDDKLVFIICEGYATGASIHEATGHAVLVGFDAGNLMGIAQALYTSMLRKGQQVTIILAADNDRWTTKPVNNPGVVRARKAAEAVNGECVIPEFMDLASKPTDFNDLHCLEGIGAVRQAFDAVLNKQAQTVAPQGAESVPDEPRNYEPFSFLGYTADQFVFYQHEQKLLKFVSQNGFQENTLLNLASLNWWEELFPKEKGGIDRTAAVNWINRQSNKVGYFDAKRIRGRGAWIDKGRVVVHHGDRLTVDGVAMDLTRIQSSFIYPMGRPMPQLHEKPLTAAEGKRLLDISRKIAWSRPGSAPMLVGWGFLAPLGGALKWRPHLWITGGAGSGKSTIVSDFLSPMIRGFCEFAQGSSTEAGVRQELGSDAIPVLMDETESNDKREKQRIEGLLALARQSSSESQARTLKGTAVGQSMHYHIRSMFCFSSINTLLGKQADAERLTRLEILPPHMRKVDNWPELEEDFHLVSTWEDLSSRLVTRALSMAKVITDTILVFKRVGSKFFTLQRLADQYGTLMAGCWCLTRDTVATDDEAMALLASYEWDEHINTDDKDDPHQTLSVIMSSFISSTWGNFTVYQLTLQVLGKGENGMSDRARAISSLRTHGVYVDAQREFIAFAPRNPNLVKLVADHPFANDLRGQLKRVPGSGNNGNKPIRFDSGPEKVITLPLSCVIDDPAN